MRKVAIVLTILSVAFINANAQFSYKNSED